MPTTAAVNLWGRQIGAVTWVEESRLGVFQFDPDFVKSGIEVSPLVMPLREAPYSFPALNYETFKGLPGLLADSLPDRFGSELFRAWLSEHNRSMEDVNPVERLCYTGKRGMGALEYEPAIGNQTSENARLEVDNLVQLANRIIQHRGDLKGVFTGIDDQAAIHNILRVGASAGGARAKAIIAWNPETNEFRSGQLPAGSGFEYWIIKFDGITEKQDGVDDPKGYGKIEYAYSEMAKTAGVVMAECRLHKEGNRNHFMTRRFDRDLAGGKIHMQSLGALTHSDFNQAATYSYEETIIQMRKLQLPQLDREQLVLRAMFNVVARNQDDHVKNLSFLMDRDGQWRLSPAYDMSYSFNSGGRWTSQHQMYLNGKRDGFVKADLIKLAEQADIKPAKAKEMLERVTESVKQWPEFAQAAKVPAKTIQMIGNTHRINLLA